MEALGIDRIHAQFHNHYENYELISSCSLYVPFYQVQLTMDYTHETKLTVLEEYICRCIVAGANRARDIIDVLAIEEKIFDFAVHHLIEQRYLLYSESQYELTSTGKVLFEALIKHESSRKTLTWMYDGLSPEYVIDFFNEQTAHRFVKFNTQNPKLEASFIMPETFPDYDAARDHHVLAQRVIEYMKTQTGAEQGHLLDGHMPIRIDRFELEPKREVLYHEYLMMIFRNEQGQYRVLAYDPCGVEGIDQRITHTLQRLMENNRLNMMKRFKGEIQESTYVNELIDALKQRVSMQANDEMEEEQQLSLSHLEDIQAHPTTALRYIMNYEIREKFLTYMKKAEKSLYIISPWMNQYIINDDFVSDIKNLLQRGVVIRIIYGISHEDDQEGRNQRTSQLADKLKKIAKHGKPDQMTISHGKTHEKLLICDNKYYINGSFNFLSYSGEEDNFFRNEGSTYSEDPTLISETIRLRFGIPS